MKISNQLGLTAIFSLAFCVAVPASAMAQTFSPYTPEQIQQFNNQPISPVETPAGPVYLESAPVSTKPKSSLDARYIKNPDGEEQAEAQEVESAAPFEPTPATFTF